MTILAMAAASSGQFPAIRFNQLNRIPDLHPKLFCAKRHGHVGQRTAIALNYFVDLMPYSALGCHYQQIYSLLPLTTRPPVRNQIPPTLIVVTYRL